MIIWSARPQRGPKAPPGQYQIRLRIGDYAKTFPFTIKMNPNLKGITETDLQEQFDLAMKIRNKTTAANQAVIDIRRIRKELQENSKKGKSKEVDIASTVEKMNNIEEALYQVRNQSNQDPLNFPIKLNNRLASLRRSIENGDARPTDGAYKVFEELSKELAGYLAEWEDLKQSIQQME